MPIAAVVKLVDTSALGAGSRKGMRVRVSPAAHKSSTIVCVAARGKSTRAMSHEADGRVRSRGGG